MKGALIASVVLNVVLIGFVVSARLKAVGQPNSAVVADTQSHAMLASPTETKPNVQIPEVETAKTYAAFWSGRTEDLFKQLKAWGAPNYLIVDILFSHDRHNFIQDKRLEILYPNGVKRWAGPPRSGSEVMSKLDDLYSKRRAELRKIMGPEFDVVLAEADPVQRIKWGNLSDEKVAGVKKIQEQYDSLATKTRGIHTGLSKDGIQASTLLNSEFAADIRTVLSPAEAEDFLTFNSPAALTLQKELSRAGVEVDEASYRTLLQKSAELRSDLLNGENGNRLYANVVKETQLHESVLGVEGALMLATSKMSNFQAIDTVLSADGLDAPTRLNLYYEYMQATMKISDAQQLMEKNPAAGKAQAMAEGTRLYDLFVTKLSPQKLEQLKKSREGQLLEQWRKGGR